MSPEAVERLDVERKRGSGREKTTWIGTALVYENGSVDVHCEGMIVKGNVFDEENGGGSYAYENLEAAEADGWIRP
jgi:hypothetical protein